MFADVNQAGIPVHVIDLTPSELQARTSDIALRLESLELDTKWVLHAYS